MSPFLALRDVRVEFTRRIGFQLRPTCIRAVNGVDIDVAARETLAVVGESGSGKSTLARAIMRLVPAQGSVVFEGRELIGLSERALRPLRQRFQIVFQDPYSSLNPVMTVAELIGEPLAVHRGLRGQARDDRVVELLDLVELSAHYLNRYPDELSGGQRQRIALARAIALEPSLLILDEAVSALDVSTQNKVVHLLEDLRDRLDLAMVFISHNLAVVEHIADRVAVMYLGRVVEEGPAARIFSAPQHPYTQALLASVPVADPRDRGERTLLRGDIPSPANLPPGCGFHTRCPMKVDRCSVEVPQLREVGGVRVACHLIEDELGSVCGDDQRG